MKPIFVDLFSISTITDKEKHSLSDEFTKKECIKVNVHYFPFCSCDTGLYIAYVISCICPRLLLHSNVEQPIARHEPNLLSESISAAGSCSCTHWISIFRPDSPNAAMTSLTLSLGPPALVKLHDALICLAKFSDTVAIEAEPNIVSYSVLRFLVRFGNWISINDVLELTLLFSCASVLSILPKRGLPPSPLKRRCFLRRILSTLVVMAEVVVFRWVGSSVRFTSRWVDSLS